jgi:hypothetical protein
VFRFGLSGRKGSTNLNISAILTDSLDVAELSTAEFRYRGISEIYQNGSRSDIACRVCYTAIVKAGIDLKKVLLDVDEESRTVTATLPEIDLKVTIAEDEFMGLLPSDASVDIDRMLKASKEDAEREARNSRELMDTARDNLRSTIEGLLFPVLRSRGYGIVWSDQEPEKAQDA